MSMEMPSMENSFETKEKMRKLAGIKNAIKILGIAALAVMPMKAAAGQEEVNTMQDTKVEMPELKLRNVDIANLDQGTKFISTAVREEMQKQGFSEEEIDATLKAPAQESSQVVSAETEE
jgi:hypothetical protein